MLFRLAAFASFVALAPLIFAQDTSDSDLTDGLFADFPQQCLDSCTAMENIIKECSSKGESVSETETMACVCNTRFTDSLESCGSCVVPAAGLSSESGNVIAQLAISVGRGCGLPVRIDGVNDPEISSILASPSAATFTAGATQSQTQSSASTQTSSSTNRQPIPNTGSLKDRIAKLNLESPSHASTSSPQSGSNSGPPSPTAVRTGATTKISDKISRFQVNAEEAPLLPSGGSFGLAPARPSGFRDRSADKPRVASLGAGRAPVPLNVIKPPRSVSAGNVGAGGSRTASDNGSIGSGREGTKTSSVGSGGGGDSRPATPSEGRPGSIHEVSTPSTSTDSTEPALENPQFTNLLAPGPRTPGAMSVSSMNVETGSIASEGERNPSESDVTPSLAPSEATGSADVPLIDAEAPKSPIETPTSAVSNVSNDGPPTPPAPSVKGPLDHLRQPSRSASIASMSSLVVEAPPDDVADLEAIPSNASETGAEARTVVTPAPTDDGNGGDEEADEKRLERTNEELQEYENDEQDPTAHGPGPEEEGGLPVRPTWAADQEAEEDGTSMPKVKCSDCDASVDLVELADHSCAPSRQSIPSASESEAAVPDSYPSQAPQAEDSVEDASPTPLAGSAILKEPAGQEREPQHKLDDYVPQTDSVVPDDIAGDDDEDVLDFYGGDDKPASSAPARDADVPLDLDDEEVNHEASPSTVMSRSHSQPTARAPKEPSGPRSHSVYLPGHYDEDEDEGYQGGTVTIVQSSR
ncbi:hypothetical protein JCM3766R1_003256 [Sporobolomyces carnicolor]